jgi:hypothetical protein
MGPEARMPDTVRKVEYFSIEVPNRPGEAFRVLQALVSADINLLACNAHAVGPKARINVVPDDVAKFRSAAAKAALVFDSTKSGFLIQGDDRPGALAEHLQRLAAARINVTGIDAVGAGQGRWGAIVWFDAADLGRAAGVLG